MSIQTINDTNYRKNISSKGLTIIDFTAPWCPPCKALIPILDGLDLEYGKSVNILKLNVDDSPEAASEFGIMSMPTMMFFKDAKPVEKLVGLRSKEVYKGIIAKYIS